MDEPGLIDESSFERIIAVGDLHGCSEPLLRILEKIDPSRKDLLIFIGDYVDRGPDSQRVVQALIDFSGSFPGCRFLKGNHEDMMLGALGFDACIHDINTWMYNGGAHTLKSYGVGFDTVTSGIPASGDPVSDFRTALPDSHRSFFMNLPLYLESDRFLFCHAGVAPHLPVAAGKSNDFDLLWTREHIHAAVLAWEKTVVCGHTPLREVLFRDRLICVDTGLYYYGKLSAVDVLSREVYQVDRRGTDR